MASHPRPQLNVDMRLVPEDEPIRMPVTSKKRRLRYALLDDDDSSQEDDQQQAAGEEPFEECRRDSFQQHDDEDQFVLPQQDDSSGSSSESENDDDEQEVPRNDVMQHQGDSSAFQPQYDNEDDLFQAAFVAPENRSTQQHDSSWDKENSQHQQQQDDFPYLNQQQDDEFPYLNQPSQEEHEVVDLCASDDDADDFTATQLTTFNGVRTPRKSPRFNANSRHCFSQNAQPIEPQPEPVNEDDDDDIVECWSSEDELNDKPRARRVTNVQERSFHQSNMATSRNNRNARKESSSFAPKASQNVARYPSTLQNYDDDEPAFVPAPSRPRDVLNRFKEERVDRRRRVRDASTGINTAASIMLRNNGPLERASDSLWFRQGQSASGSHASTTSRNDLMGGSGVGAGNYTFTTAGQSFQPPAPAKKKAAKKKTTTKKKSTAGGKKKKKWGGKKNYYRKKGGGKGKSSSRAGGGRSRSNRGRGSNEEYSRQDPLLGGVGGASITF